MNAQEIFQTIIAEYDEGKILERIDEAIPEYVDPDQVEDEFDGDVYECYEETGRNAAESQILHELLNPYKEFLSTDAFVELMEQLAEHWGLSLG